jgi:hypothetical protein
MHYLLVIFLIFTFVSIPGSEVKADSPLPPGIAWFIFNSGGEPIDTIVSAQLVGCADTNCAKPKQLFQYGECALEGCVPFTMDHEDRWGELHCANDRCRLLTYPLNMTYFRFLVQFPDKTLTSEVFQGISCAVGEVQTWRLTVKGAGLVVENDTAPVNGGKSAGFLKTFFFSHTVELIVSGLFYLIGLKILLKDLPSKLLMVFLVNLITLPIVWFYFTSFILYEPVFMRTVGTLSLIISIAYSIVVIHLYKTEKDRKKKIVLSVLSVPIVFIIWFITFFMSSYGNQNEIVWNGLSPTVAILLAEIFAFIAEAALIWVLSRKDLSIIKACILSILMNVSSCCLGIWILGRFW